MRLVSRSAMLMAACLFSTTALSGPNDLVPPPLEAKKPATTITQGLCELIALGSIRAMPEAAAKFPAGVLEKQERNTKTLITVARDMFLTQYSQNDLSQLATKFNAMVEQLSAEARSGKHETFLDAHRQCYQRSARIAAPYDGIAVSATAEDGTTITGTTSRYRGEDGEAPGVKTETHASATLSAKPIAATNDEPRTAGGKPDYQVPPQAKKADAKGKDSDAYHEAYRAMLKEYGQKLDDHMARMKALDEAIPPEKRTKEDWARIDKEAMDALATIDQYSKKMLEWKPSYDKSVLD